MSNQSDVQIIVKAKDDQSPAILSDNYIHSTLRSFVILEEATSGKKTGVVIHTKLKDGKDIFINTTGAIFKGMADALRGAEFRFSEGKPTIPDYPVIKAINDLIKENSHQIDTDEISDGKNTFNELYALLTEAAVSLKHPSADLSYSVRHAIDELRERIIKALERK